MRHYLRLAVLCLACGFCSLLYAFSQLAVSPEDGAGGGGGKPQAAAASWLAGGGRSAARGAGSAGPAARPGRSDRYSLKVQPIERMHLAVVACGERLEETVTMMKSAVIFSIKPLWFHIFAEDQLHDSFKGILDSWSFLQTFNYSLYPITFPSENAAEWKKLFKPCASQRLFLPLILKEVDSLLYVDTDILFLRPVDDIWSLLKKFNSTQIAAMAPEHEEPRIGWYNRFARHPYYGKTGVNSGVMLMNVTRMRRKYFKNDMTTVRLRWGDILMPLLKKYKLNITWGDQDLLNIIFFHNPACLFFRVNGIIGQTIVYMEATAQKQKKKESSFFMGTECSFEDDNIHSLLKPLELELQKTVHTYCGKIYKIFIKQLTKSVRDRYDRMPKEGGSW
ncbi:hypothetical protein MC885_015609 [Smutsia gigantea]|nr:hypothetical protein MC885_015609 [Smutsia gigantea]